MPVSTALQTAATNQLAANENPQLPAGDRAISAMRSMLGRSSAASRYASLNDQQKSMILFGARLKPAEHLHKRFESFSHEEREQIRMSLIALCDLSKKFMNVSLDKDQFKPAKPQLVKRIESSGTNQIVVAEVKDELKQMNHLIAELETDRKQIKNQMQ
ncbi:MAG: hypothetical protein ACPGUD_13100 [Parashewanella sp.]